MLNNLKRIEKALRPSFLKGRKRYQYSADGLGVNQRLMSWRDNPRFASAWNAASKANMEGWEKAGSVPDIRWRAHVCCWAAENALKLGQGHFVECGVHTGLLSLTVLHYLNSNYPERFWLFDTFAGVPIEGASLDEDDTRLAELVNDKIYTDVWDIVQRNFAEFQCVQLVQGRLPGTLATVELGQISYLSIDLNVTEYERATIEELWPKIMVGGFVIIDDYGWVGHEGQHEFWNGFAAKNGQLILSLPTGQGLILKR